MFSETIFSHRLFPFFADFRLFFVLLLYRLNQIQCLTDILRLQVVVLMMLLKLLQVFRDGSTHQLSVFHKLFWCCVVRVVCIVKELELSKVERKKRTVT